MFVFLPVDPLIGVALNDVSAALLGFLPGNSSLDLELMLFLQAELQEFIKED